MANSSAKELVLDPNLTTADYFVLSVLEQDIQDARIASDSQDVDSIQNNHHTDNSAASSCAPRKNRAAVNSNQSIDSKSRTEDAISKLTAFNDPKHLKFQPTVFTSIDVEKAKIPTLLNRLILQPYIKFARSLVRVETDVVMVTHLLLYFCTSVPSAVLLYYSFSWWHGVMHLVMQLSYVGTYTLMMHQHIHMGGILNKRLALFDMIFPYITDPLMGHSWNSYYYHHVKHHHVEGNGPDDLSSTVRYQRDSISHFLQYVGRFYFLVWIELPMYFWRKGRAAFAAKVLLSELFWYSTLASMLYINSKPTIFVLLVPHLLLRFGLMVGNWGQHAFVDADQPDSDYRSSITLVDVPSNRHCFNDGYHTSHHLNPLRHWREHPVSFLKSKETYASQQALVFHNIDYIMITVRLLMKDYDTLAKCLVPIGSQINLSMEERAALLRRHTQRFTEEEIREKFKTK